MCLSKNDSRAVLLQTKTQRNSSNTYICNTPPLAKSRVSACEIFFFSICNVLLRPLGGMVEGEVVLVGGGEGQLSDV